MASAKGEGLLASAARGRRAARGALAHLVADLAIPDAYRLDDRRRASILGIIRRLLSALEDHIRDAAVDECAAVGPALRGAAIALAQGRGAALRLAVEDYPAMLDAALVEAAFERAFEHRFADRRQPGRARFATLLARNPDPALAQRVADLAAADARRVDRLGEPVLLVDDLTASVAERAAWLAGAVLRREAVRAGAEDDPAFDAALARAVRTVLAAREEPLGIRVRAARLAARLSELGENDDALLVSLAAEGEIELVVACIGRRAALPGRTVWQLLTIGQRAALPTLLRAIDVATEPASHLLGDLSATAVPPDPYDAIPLARARAQLAQWRMPPDYLDAIDSLLDAGA